MLETFMFQLPYLLRMPPGLVPDYQNLTPCRRGSRRYRWRWRRRRRPLYEVSAAYLGGWPSMTSPSVLRWRARTPWRRWWVPRRRSSSHPHQIFSWSSLSLPGARSGARSSRRSHRRGFPRRCLLVAYCHCTCTTPPPVYVWFVCWGRCWNERDESSYE